MKRRISASGAGQGRGPDKNGPGPAFKVGEVGGERPQGVGAHARAGEMCEGRDIVVGEELGKAIPAIHGQDGRERIELERAPGLRVRSGEATAVSRAHRSGPIPTTIGLSARSTRPAIIALRNGPHRNTADGRGGGSRKGSALGSGVSEGASGRRMY